MSQKRTFDNTSEWPAWRPEVPHTDLPLIPPPIDLETRPGLKTLPQMEGRELVDLMFEQPY